VTLIDLEFGGGFKGAVAVSDVASSLVSLDELLRDLASIAAYPSSAEFRSVEVVAIEMRSPLTVKLSVVAILPQALKAFQEICRDIIVFRTADINKTLALLDADGTHARITEQEAERISGHIASLQNAKVRLTRMDVKEQPTRPL